MADRNKIDSNETGLRIAEEESYKVLPGTPVWYPAEPNSYNDFGGEIDTVARRPINEGRQNKKGVVVDVNSQAGYETDLTQTNIADLLQGFFFASHLRKEEYGGDSEITNVDGTADEYDGTDIEDDMAIGYLVHASGFTNAANNGIKEVTGVTGPNTLAVAEVVVDETPPAAAKLVHVGVQGAANDLAISMAGSLPQLTSTVLDFTTLGMVTGEWIYIGGDASDTVFPTNATNNGWARVRTIEANALTLDKTVGTMVTETTVLGETIRFFFGRVLKNRNTAANIVRRSYQMERLLGAPNDSAPAEIQAEYVRGAVANECAFNIPTADKFMATLSFMGADMEFIDGPTALKGGTRPSLVESDAFNTSSDVARIKLSEVTDGDAAPSALFAFVTDMTLTVNNNVKGNKAIGTVGNFDVSAGQFDVTGDLTAYFQNVAAVQAVQNNADITFDFQIVKANSGIVFDVPLVALGDGRPNVEQDEAIKLPLSSNAATGAKIHANLDHTLLLSFFDYLPDVADAS